MTIIYKVCIKEVNGWLFHESMALHKESVLGEMQRIKKKIEESNDRKIAGREFKFEVINYEI